MKESNLFSFPINIKFRKIITRKPKKKSEIQNFMVVNEAFANKSAQEFVESILLGELYRELKPKKTPLKREIIRI